MSAPINPLPASAPRLRRLSFCGACLTLLLAGCGGGGSVSVIGGGGSGVPTAAQIAEAQAALDGTVPTDDSIAAKQIALDADADKGPE